MSERREAGNPPSSERNHVIASLPGWLLEHAQRRPRRVALRQQHAGIWREYTWADYALRVARVAAGFRALGVEPGDRVAIHSDNRVEWVITDLAIQGIGAVTVGVYPTSPPPEVEYVLSHSGAKVLVAEDQEQVDKVSAVRAALPELRHVAVVDTRGLSQSTESELGERTLSFAELERLGERAGDAAAEAELRASVSRLGAGDVAVIVYTSGTTGPPKGAMLTHANLVAAGEVGRVAFGAGPRDEVLSYLPLCHVAERLFSVVDGLSCGYVVDFGGQSETFLQDLRDVQPTFFLGVPRVWEKLLAGTEIKMADASWVKRAVYRFWLARGQAVARRRRARGRLSAPGAVVYFLGWLFVYRALRDKIGMRRVRTALSGAAPIASDVLEWFWAIGVPIREAYGQTENTAICTVMPTDDVRIGTVGRALPEVELRIADDGEILTRSAGVFAGYFRDDEATRATVDPDGWLHTGDVGVVDDDGYLTITDRKKDLIITAGGKNVSPQHIENLLKVSPFIREAIVVGDRRPYLTALIGVETDTVCDWCTRRGLTYTTYRDLTELPEVRELVEEIIAGTNAQLAQVEQVKRFELLGVELDEDAGQLTATQKVKRAAIAKEFADDIEELYGSRSAG